MGADGTILLPEEASGAIQSVNKDDKRAFVDEDPGFDDLVTRAAAGPESGFASAYSSDLIPFRVLSASCSDSSSSSTGSLLFELAVSEDAVHNPPKMLAGLQLPSAASRDPSRFLSAELVVAFPVKAAAIVPARASHAGEIVRITG